MIEVRPKNPVGTVEEPDPVIASFTNSEWWDLIKLARQKGFEPPDIHIHYPRPYDYPVEVDVETAQDLYEAIGAVYNDDEAVPYASTWKESTRTQFWGRVDLPDQEPEEAYISREIPHDDPGLHVGKLQVRQLMECAEIGAEHAGGLVVKRVKDED